MVAVSCVPYLFMFLNMKKSTFIWSLCRVYHYLFMLLNMKKSTFIWSQCRVYHYLFMFLFVMLIFFFRVRNSYKYSTDTVRYSSVSLSDQVSVRVEEDVRKRRKQTLTRQFPHFTNRCCCVCVCMFIV